MNTRHKTLWIAIVAAGFAMAAGVRAQDEYGFEDTSAAKPGAVYENFIEIGGGYTDDGNGKFGEYTTGVTDALQDEGGFPVGALRLSGGDDSTARSWEVSAGVGNGRSLEASYGIQNSFGISLYGDRIEKAEYGEAGTVYDGVSETMLLPATYSFTTSFPIPAAPPGSYDRANYSTEDIRHERQIFGLEGFKHIGDAWTLSLGFENQDKSGDDVFGGNQGFSGTALVPEELDTRHQQMRARIDYADRCLQQGIELYLSDFENGNDAIAYQNAIVPGSYVPNNASGAFRPLGLEQVASEPDNRYLRVGMDGGYSVGMMTRLSWFADWSRGEQDEDFLPVVLDTNYYPSVNPVFPFSNLDGEVERANVKLSLVGRPFSRFDYRVQYAYKDRDARHDPLPVNELSYTYNNTAPGFTSKVYDKQTQALGAEAGYRFAGRVKLRGGYEYEEADRDTDELEYDSVARLYSPASFTDSTAEDKVWAELSIATIKALTIKLRAEYNVIEADLSDETGEVISPGGIPRRGTPVFLLDRDQEVYEIEANYALGAAASVYARYDVVRDDFDNDTFGLERRDSGIWNVGFSWSPSNAVVLSAYASRENYEFEQIGRQMNQAGATPYIDWGLDTEDEIDAFGLSMDWVVVEERFSLSVDLAYMESDSSYASEFIGSTYPAGTALPVFGDTPDSQDELLRFSVSGVYHWNDRIDVTGRYIYETRDAEDWGWSDQVVSPATPADPAQASARYLAFAWERPDYNSQLVVMSVRYKF